MTLLVKNGLVYDGSEKAPEKKDVLISRRKILKIGSFPAFRADQVIDATGAWVLPGFVDFANTIDHYFEVFSASAQEKLIAEGITTVIGGNGGFSLAPFTKKSLNLVSETGDSHYRNVNWHSVGEFLKVLSAKKMKINFGTLVGHATVRESLTKGEMRDLTDHELEAMKRIFRESFREGAFGFSVELGSFYSRQVPPYEILALTRTAAEEGRIAVVGLRYSREKLKEAVGEIIEAARVSSANVEVSDFSPAEGFSESYLEAKDIFEKTAAEANINFDLNPLGESILPLHRLLPEWFQSSGLKKMVEAVQSSAMEETLLSYLTGFEPAKVRVVRAPRTLKMLEGKTLKEFAAGHNLPEAKAVLRFMRLTRLQAIVALADIDLKTMNDFLASAKSFVSSSGLSGVFIRFLNAVSESGLLPLEKAVAKITSGPAQKYRLPLRGLLKEGYEADLVVVKEKEIVHTVLNGQWIFRDGRHENTAAGEILKPVR